MARCSPGGSDLVHGSVAKDCENCSLNTTRRDSIGEGEQSMNRWENAAQLEKDRFCFHSSVQGWVELPSRECQGF